MKVVSLKQAAQKSFALLLGSLCLSGLSSVAMPGTAVAEVLIGVSTKQTPTLRDLIETVPVRPIRVPAKTPPDILSPELSPSAVEQSQEVKLLLRLSDRKVYVYRGDSLEKSYPVAIGRPGWETPTGEFEIFHQIEDPGWTNPLTGDVMTPGPDNPLGDRWIAFWTDGNNSIGFHGTPNRESIGQAASHGCIRMYNEDVRELYEIVSVGTPVIVEL